MLQTPRWRAEDGTLDSYDLHIAAWLRGHEDDYLARNVTASEIERSLHISRPRIRKSLDKLVELGIIEVERGSRDRLVITVDVTVWEQGTGSGAPDDMERGSTSAAPCLPLVSNKLEIPPKAPPGGRAPSRAKVRADAELARVDALFEAFWTAYPRKIGKPAARRSFHAAIKREPDVHRIGAGMRAWRFHWSEAQTEVSFIPHPATWLNQQRWNDTPPPLAARVAPLSAMERAWITRHPGASDADARAHTAEVRGQRDVIDAHVIDRSVAVPD